jgi:hypothetical protein
MRSVKTPFPTHWRSFLPPASEPPTAASWSHAQILTALVDFDDLRGADPNAAATT